MAVREEPAEASAQVIAEESEAMAETEEVEMSSLSEINEPEESDTFSDDEESAPALQAPMALYAWFKISSSVRTLGT